MRDGIAGRLEYPRGEWNPWTEDTPEFGLLVSEAVERFLTAKGRLKRATTVRAYTSTLEAFASRLPGR